MGITIHFTFARSEPPCTLNNEAAKRAKALGMMIRHHSRNHLVVHPHPQCETLSLHWHRWKTVRHASAQSTEEADRVIAWLKARMAPYVELLHDGDWVCCNFTKTQYAGIGCHAAVAQLLRFIAGKCTLAHIVDEAGYYELGDADGFEKAKQCFDSSNKVIAAIAQALKQQFGKENVITGDELGPSFLNPHGGKRR